MVLRHDIEFYIINSWCTCSAESPFIRAPSFSETISDSNLMPELPSTEYWSEILYPTCRNRPEKGHNLGIYIQCFIRTVNCRAKILKYILNSTTKGDLRTYDWSIDPKTKYVVREYAYLVYFISLFLI